MDQEDEIVVDLIFLIYVIALSWMMMILISKLFISISEIASKNYLF